MEQPDTVHPLVIDAVTNRARLATQEDVWMMERKCKRHDALVAQLREHLRMEDYYAAQLLVRR